MKNNTGEAILILGSIYFFTIIEGWSKWILFFLIGLAIFTWSYHSKSKYFDEVIELQMIKLRLDIEFMKAQTRFYVARGAAILKGLQPR